MAIIKTVSPEEAQGEIKEVYDAMLQGVGMVPSPLQLASASPGIFKLYWQSIKYFSDHPTLSFPLLSTIRFLVAEHLNYAFCTDFNKGILIKQGLTDEDIEELKQDPSKAPLEDNEKAMLGFVLKAIASPDDVDQQDMDRLHDLGWADPDILDALSHGTNMVSSSIWMKAFKMDMAC